MTSTHTNTTPSHTHETTPVAIPSHQLRFILAQEFVGFANECGVLSWGAFTTKAGRVSPYFFNAGLFDDGEKLGRLAQFYAFAILNSGIEFDMLFGPAYKGIPLGAAVAVELARLGRNVPFAYNRKEAKNHGERGMLVGAPLQGKVLVIDDVISAGTAMQQSLALIQATGATVSGIVVALDRQEKAADVNGNELPHSAIQYMEHKLGLQVCAIATLTDLLGCLNPETDAFQQVQAYRQRYGVTLN